MQYMGSKNKISKQLLPIILKNRRIDQWYVEPFVGGCNMIDKVAANRIGNDINEKLIDMWRALQNGWSPPTIVSKELYYDPKSRFQELVQEKTGITPNYKLEKAEGPDHAKTFTMAVFIGDKKISLGKGYSKQAAEQEAARTAIDVWEQDI